VSEPASISTGIAERYATAVFELAVENKILDGLEHDITVLEEVLAESADLRALIHSPIYSRTQKMAAIKAVAAKLDLSETMRNTLELMATKRRLFVLPQLLKQLRALIAEEKGEVTAEVVVAKALSKAQQEKLAKALKKSVGKDVKIQASVDDSLIGGMIVKVGSKMIDTSIRSKLQNLQNAMKEVG